MLREKIRWINKAKNQIRNRIYPTAFIFLYHRIAKPNSDAMGLSVSPANFKSQLAYLKQNYTLVPLVQLVIWIRAKRLKNNAAAITFDDGYADNLHNALPILKELNIPATFFVTSGYIDSKKPFYWESEAQPENRGRPISQEEFLKLAACNLVEIGAHTVTHPRLSALPVNYQEKEIIQSKSQIEELLSRPILSFAYPFGGKESFNHETVEIVKKSGFNYACSNIHKRVTNRSSLYTLPRFVIRNWNDEELKNELKKWV